MTLSIVGALLVRSGLVVYCAGTARAKFVASALVRILVDFSISAAASYLAFRFLSQNDRAIGAERALLAATLATGFAVSSLGERTKLSVSLRLSVLVAVTGSLIAVATTKLTDPSTWRFMLLVMISACSAGLAAAKLVGPREGRYHRDGSSSVFPSHNLPLQTIGAMLLLAGALLILQQVQGLFVPAIAIGISAAISTWKFGKIDPFMILIALAAGIPMLLAPLPPNNRADAFVLAGLAAGGLGPLVFLWVETKLRIDDAAGLCAPVLLSAIGWYAACDLIHVMTGHGDIEYWVHGAILLVASVFAGLFAGALAVRSVANPQASEADVYDGLDLAEHDVNAYPDFQQTMIKSFHLRER